MSSNYQPIVVPLDAVLERKQIVAQGLPVRYFTVVELSEGATAKLHVGAGEPFPLKEGSEGECCPAETEGLFVSTDVAQPGAEMTIVVGNVNLSQGL